MGESISSTLVSFGVREVDITPPLGIHLHNWSAAEHMTATGVHRPLLGKVLALVGESTATLLISLDLGWWMAARDELLLREAILHATGLPADQLIVCLIHTHAGPSLAREDEHEPGGHLIAPWLELIARQLAHAALESLADLTPGVIDFELGSCDLASNRDLSLADGSVACGFNPGPTPLNRLLVGRICDEAGVARVILAHYAAHPTSLGPANTLLSPDYVGAARELVEEVAGASFIFLQGPSGELAPREQYARDTAVAERHGRVLGYATLAVLERMSQPGLRTVFDHVLQSGAPLAITRSEPAANGTLTVRSVTAALPTQDNRPPHDPSLPLVVVKDRATRAARIGAAMASEVLFTVTLWQIGRVVFLAHPGEAYSDLQTILQARHPEAIIAVVNLANGSHAGYIAPRSAYADHRYQSWQSPLGPSAFGTLLESLSSALFETFPQPATPKQ